VQLNCRLTTPPEAGFDEPSRMAATNVAAPVAVLIL
jgi:hypothetical protein